eukprot:jgi/Bigna1/89659/estExt_fgenesh1_pg.C_530049
MGDEAPLEIMDQENQSRVSTRMAAHPSKPVPLEKASSEILPGYNYSEVEPRPHTLSYMVPAPPRWCYKYKVGRMYVCRAEKITSELGEPEIKIRCMLGACWPMTFITMGIISIISLSALWTFLPRLNFMWHLAAMLILGTNLVALGLTGTVDPGIVRRDPEDMEREPDIRTRRWSNMAKAYIRKNEAFCEESQVIVRGMDHFCPWTGTVIAEGNMPYFQMFLGSLCTLLGFVALVAFTSSLTIAAGRKPNPL